MSPKISASEWEIMNVLWDKRPLTAIEVFDALPSGHGWKQKTVNTFLARLQAKGVLTATKEGRAFIFTPMVERDECISSESESFLQRVFKGATGSLVLHFCEQGDLSDNEIRELQQLLKAKKARK